MNPGLTDVGSVKRITHQSHSSCFLIFFEILNEIGTKSQPENDILRDHPGIET